VGACQRSGVKVCSPDESETVCNATPGTPTAEVCNGIDDNCNGQVDEGVLLTFFQDADGDGFGDPARSTQACKAPAGFVADNHDCNDGAAAIHPGAAELCNGVDDNCNGTKDEGFDVGSACTAGIGACARSGVNVCAADGSKVVCNATPGTPTAEVCNGIDDNCNGQSR